MARTAPTRAPKRSVTSRTSFERTARRWYITRKPSILRACRIILLVLLSVAICFLLFRKHLIHGLHDLHDASSAPQTAPRCRSRLGDFIDSPDPLYRPFVPVDQPSYPFPVLQDSSKTDSRCLEGWLLSGESACRPEEWRHEANLDVVWTWVNGSDPRWKETMSKAARDEGIFSPGFHYREQNELQYSMRSVMSALSSVIRTIHLVVSDFPFTDVDHSELPSHLNLSSLSRSEARLRIAQTPRWLDFGSLGCKDGPQNPRPALQLVAHSEIFHLPSRVDEVHEGEWRNRALPNFNSKVIESRLGWVPGLAENILSFNDDFFLLQPHTLSDFHSSLYGTMIRFDDGYYQQVRPILDKKNLNDAGETGGLWHANYVLSKRFPKRLRHYLPHVPKAVTRSLHHEAALMFEKDLYLSTQRQFRESTRGLGDIQMQWLSIALRVERWREALLWTFVVAKLGGSNGLLDSGARQTLHQVLGVKGMDRLDVVRGHRLTLAKMRENLIQAGLEIPAATETLFSSLDGHLPPIPRPGVAASSNDKCTLDLDHCFGSFGKGAETSFAHDVFKRMTFERPECGDCLIMALVTASGPLGLSAFMPDRHTIFKNEATIAPMHHTPLLPITDTWQAADFSLKSVIRDTEMPGAEVDLKRYTSRLLSRYLYTSGQSRTQFHMIDNPEQAARAFAEIDTDPQATMLGLNDNIQRDEAETGRIMTAWMQQRWPDAVWWERQI